MSITPDPGGALPREEAPNQGTYQRPAAPPPPPPPPPGYSYQPAPPAPAPVPQQAYAPPPPPPPPAYAPPPPAYNYGPPAPPAPAYGYAEPAADPGLAGAKWFPPVVLVALVLLTGGILYVGHQLGEAQKASQLQISKLQDDLDATRNQLNGVNGKTAQLKEELSSTATNLRKGIGATQAQIGETRKNVEKTAEQLQAEQKQASAQLGQQITTVQADAATRAAAISGEVGGVRKDVDATKKDLDTTKAQLKSTIGDLGVQSGLVARNHDDLMELRKRNERNYFEFNLTKAKTASKVGDIAIRVTKTDPKKGRYTIEVNADDKVVEKKDKNVNEPLQFYLARARGIPYEIVVNQVDKDKVVGYLATPK